MNAASPDNQWLVDLFSSTEAPEPETVVISAYVPKTIVSICPKCSGHGKLTGYQHIAAGMCFKCGGSGRISKTI